MAREEVGIQVPDLAVEVQSSAPSGYVDETFVANASGFYVPVERRSDVVTGCSDDRPPTTQSAADIDSRFLHTMELGEGYARFWGSKYGIAAVVLAASAAVRLEDGITQNGGYWQMVDSVARVTGKRAIGHSAEANEKSVDTFCVHGGEPLGCLLCAKVGAAVSLLLHDELVQEVAAADQEHVMGETSTFEQVLIGFEHLYNHFANLSPSSEGQDFSVNRADFAADVQAGNPVMILAGKHALARNTAVMLGFESRTVTNPSGAAQEGLPFYGVDIATVGEEIGVLVQEREIFPTWDYFVSGATALSSAVRAALVAHDAETALQGKLDPRYLPLGVKGDATEAIDQLNFTYGN